MKNSIAWHMGCLLNQKIYLNQLVADLRRKESAVEELTRGIEFYQKQINEAYKRDVNEFDRERLLVKKGVKL